MSASDFVLLRGGPALPLAAVRLAWDLELRGLTLTIEGNVLRVGPCDLLTDADRALIRRWKPHLLAIVAYNADAHELTQPDAGRTHRAEAPHGRARGQGRPAPAETGPSV